MIRDRIYEIGILIYYFLVIAVITICFLLLYLDISKTIDTFAISTISFLLGKFSTLISGKLLTYHQQILQNSHKGNVVQSDMPLDSDESK